MTTYTWYFFEFKMDALDESPWAVLTFHQMRNLQPNIRYNLSPSFPHSKQQNRCTNSCQPLLLFSGWERNLEFPSIVNSVPCVDDPTTTGVNFTITGLMIGFVTLGFKDAQTNEHLHDMDIGIIRPPEQIQDNVSEKFESMQTHNCNTAWLWVSYDLQYSILEIPSTLSQ